MILKLRMESQGVHVRVHFFVGPFDGNLASAGALVFRHSEAMAIATCLTSGALLAADVAAAGGESITEVIVEPQPGANLDA